MLLLCVLTAHLSAWMHRRVQAWKQGPGAELRQQRPQPPGSAHISSIPVLHSPGAPPGGPAYIELGAAAIVALWCCSQREMSASSLFSLLLFHAGVWHSFFDSRNVPRVLRCSKNGGGYFRFKKRVLLARGYCSCLLARGYCHFSQLIS